ncbi:MAG TPA: hypothetical protein VFP65_21660 [Anaeromyxobacteraceae bacterium]|nr:hypothetical protein [Anaeromyxobacteraceae bacterium]
MRGGALLALAAASLAAAGGCAQDLEAHVRVGPRPPNPDSDTPRYVDRGTRTPPPGYTVDRFRLVLRNVRLQSDPTDAGEPTADVRVVVPGPILVDLSGAQLAPGALTRIMSGYGIGAKGFYELDLDLSPVTDADAAAHPELAPLLGKTFVIEGRRPDGSAFTFASSLQQTLLRPSVYRMGMNHNNLDVNLDTDLWLIGPGGAPADPGSDDPGTRAVIEENVAGSIDAYDDSNVDGEPDPLA